MNKKTIQKILKIDIACIIVSLINWIIAIYPKYGNRLNLANNILVYGIVLCCVLAIFYILVGCEKEYGSTIYKLFINIYAVIELSTLINSAQLTPYEIITTCLRFGALVLLSEAKDLGEKKSKIIALIPIATTIADLIEINYYGAIAYAWKGILIEIILEITVLLFVIAKYIDKKDRKAKDQA